MIFSLFTGFEKNDTDDRKNIIMEMGQRMNNAISISSYPGSNQTEVVLNAVETALIRLSFETAKFKQSKACKSVLERT